MAAEDSLLVSLLVAGKVATFADTFVLANRAARVPGDHPSIEELTNVSARLALAEEARRRGDTAVIMREFSAIGAAYRESGHHDLAAHFFERSLSLARAVRDVAAEMAALHEVGLAATARRALQAAREAHEAQRALAEQAGDAAALAQASQQLLRVYSALAAEAEEKGHSEPSALQEALALHLSALHAARQGGGAEGGSASAEGRCSYSVGRAYVLAKQPAEGVQHLRAYLRICASTPGEEERVGQAYAALAAAYQANGQLDAAAECLMELLSVAQSSGQGGPLAEAAENLGIMEAQRGQTEEAVAHLTQAFDIRRKMLAEGSCARSDVERARVLLGMVKGASKLPGMVQGVLQGLQHRGGAGGSGSGGAAALPPMPAE